MLGFVETVRGRHGGLRLGMEPDKINVGEVVRHTESDFDIAECFGEENLGCIYSASCALKGVLGRASSAFLSVLDDVTLESLTGNTAGGSQGRGAQKTDTIRFLSRTHSA
jgi:Rrf2 family nitric oxide-sensitive transcriptional repressor